MAPLSQDLSTAATQNSPLSLWEGHAHTRCLPVLTNVVLSAWNEYPFPSSWPSASKIKFKTHPPSEVFPISNHMSLLGE